MKLCIDTHFYIYVMGVAIVWAIILGIIHFSGNVVRFRTYSLVCGGFMLGMLAMYIAVHLYRWK